MTVAESMAKRLIYFILLGTLVLFELTTSFPLSQVLNHNNGREFEASNNQEQLKSEISSSLQTKDSSTFFKIKRSSKEHVNRKKAHLPGPSHLRLASKDQDAPRSRSAFERWFAANHRDPKFIAISIFVGCLVFMIWAFVITCCWYDRRETKRIKKATHVDVQSRHEVVPNQVSKIEGAHIDVGGY